ncbi:MAG: 2-nitropropane dioxygenase [Magnetococcales bacterium]|nr:nitronate monooxygenase [Magnetococcales bacterium]NGZ25837.1 2-nitropropane dioxygenase [Magnetococcales bacterium]
MWNERLRDSWQRGRDFLGVENAILGGAMSWLSERHLVAAISEAGGFGVIACGGMPPDLLREEIRATRKLTSRPFGVNLIVIHPQLAQLVQVVVEEKVTHCVMAGGIPDSATVRSLKENNVKVVLFAPSLTLAKGLVRRGADALIIEGHEAGGHVGPVSTIVLAQEILPQLRDVPVFVAGGLADGEMIAVMMAMGAAGGQLGTRFVCTNECIAHDNFKNAFLKAQAKDAVVTPQFDAALPVIPVRALANKGTQAFCDLQLKLLAEVKGGRMERKDAILELEHFWVGALRRAVLDGDVENGSVMAGQSVGRVQSIQPVATVMEELVTPILEQCGKSFT